MFSLTHHLSNHAQVWVSPDARDALCGHLYRACTADSSPSRWWLHRYANAAARLDEADGSVVVRLFGAGHPDCRDLELMRLLSEELELELLWPLELELGDPELELLLLE